MTLSDIGNYAQILSLLSFPLTVLVWLVTAERFAKFWRRWKKALFFLFFLIALAGTWSLGWLTWATNVVSLPVWKLCALGASGFVLSWLLLKVRHWLASLAQKPPATSGEVEGIEWHWEWSGNRFLNLNAFCPDPACRCRLRTERIDHVVGNFGYQMVDHVRVVCQRCDFRRDYDCNYAELERRVSFEIERRFKTGEYS